MFKLLLTLSFIAFPLSASAGATACVYALSGDVQLMKTGETAWLPAAKGMPVAEGYRLKTGDKASCELIFKDGTFLKVDPGTETSFDELKITPEGRTYIFKLLRGKALWLAAKLKKFKSKFSVHTPVSVCAVRGTDFAVMVSSTGETNVGLFEGVMAVSGPDGQEKELLAGSEASAAAGGEVAVQNRLSRLMQVEKRRYEKLRGRVEALRKRMDERDGFVDDYINRQQTKLDALEKRRQEKLDKR
ncbi:MAG TPA: hypothetical protein DCZ92_07895 [Elusimicrobia bacterium]|nr:MAG: hypothetical protein A2016_02165 [Elusimicrobia bacterium GWF2_62_30]HBA60726.1 hypothetical protein [Elusimicrobiota bacterium]